MCVLPALQQPKVRLLVNAEVTRLDTSPSGREVTAVEVMRNGQLETYAAGIVVVACGAVNSAALLPGSGNPRHPKGLANSSDVVGRYYMRHLSSAWVGDQPRAEPHALPENARSQRLLLRRGRLAPASREHPDGRQVRR